MIHFGILAFLLNKGLGPSSRQLARQVCFQGPSTSAALKSAASADDNMGGAVRTLSYWSGGGGAR